MIFVRMRLDTLREKVNLLDKDGQLARLGSLQLAIDADRVLLIRRRFEPLKGHWSLPGGAVEVGETLQAAVAREVLEETGLTVEVGSVLDVFDRITWDDASRVRYHFVLVDYLCRNVGGDCRPGSDVDAVVWARIDDLERYALTEKALAVIAKGRAAVGGARGTP